MTNTVERSLGTTAVDGATSPEEIYGKELILDLHGCETSQFTRSSIEQFCTQLCELIDMERWRSTFLG